MNKIISTDKRIFMCIVGPSESGKTRLIHDMLTFGTFQKPFTKIYYFYRHWQPSYAKFIQDISNIEFVQLHDDLSIVSSISESIEPHIDNRTLMIFDDVAEEILGNSDFSNLATSGRHKNISIVFIKHNLYQQGKHSVTIDKNTTHLVLMNNPRIGKQLKILGSELGEAKFLEECYKKAVKENGQNFGHLMIDFYAIDSLRYCSGVVSRPSFFWVPRKDARVKYIDDKSTNALYSRAHSQILRQSAAKNIYPAL